MRKSLDFKRMRVSWGNSFLVSWKLKQKKVVFETGFSSLFTHSSAQRIQWMLWERVSSAHNGAKVFIIIYQKYFLYVDQMFYKAFSP